MAAIEEEKISRQKHVADFPIRSVKECLSLSGLKASQIDVVAIPRQNGLEIRSHIMHMLKYFPKSLNLLRKNSAVLDSSIKYARYLKLKSILKSVLNRDIKIVEVPHHVAHAASVSFQSEYENSITVIYDAIAEYDTVWIGKTSPTKIEKIATTKFPNSLGLAYAAATDFLGFRPFNDEWKVMGMAAYGKPRYYEELNDLISVSHDMKIQFNDDLWDFRFHGKAKWFSSKFKLLDIARDSKAEIEQKHYDFANSFQTMFEDKLLSLFRLIKANYSDQNNLCLSGGAALNCLVNGRLVEEGIFDNVYIDCCPGDSGSALGAAIYINQQINGTLPESQHHNMRLGRGYSPKEIEDAITRAGINYRKYDSISEIAKEIRQDSIIGVFQGRSEFGPRALGARSILADPRHAEIKDVINSKVKYRESFRPFAPSILKHRQEEYFPTDVFSPYMSFAIKAKSDIVEKIPAVIHADNTARLQSVSQEQDSFYFELISEFENEHGIPLLLNTSFNIRGEPIVYTPKDAIDTFVKANLDVLVMGSFMVKK